VPSLLTPYIQPGTTALHLAASLGRVDVVKLLLDQPEIDDTIRDFHGRTCLDVAKGRTMIQATDGMYAPSVLGSYNEPSLLRL
jgi:hypothetical protein